jgi:hypothetical protein
MLAIVCLTALEITALLMGIDGALFSTVIATIAALAGYTIKGHSVPSRIMAAVRKR